MDKLDRIIKESIDNVLNTREPLIEMARINRNENRIFPYNSWEIKIWSNDHNPPHFHIISDGWDVSFVIETGELLEIQKNGRKKSVLEYMMSNVEKWLQSKCVIQQKLTNQENAVLQWDQMHDN